MSVISPRPSRLPECVTAEAPAACEAVEAFRTGRLSPRELLETCLDRIAQLDPLIKAWVVLDIDGARRAADEAAHRYLAGTPLGPLDGIPIGVKDLIDVAGLPTRAGSPFRANQPPAEHDAPLIAQLRRGGAIILGKTVTTEFACFDPSPTTNPWNARHTPGGSSSGSAAAVAARMVPVALGSQTGGSIIRPASYCGVAGFKPSYGRVDATDVVPLSALLDHVGCMARTVHDLRTVFHAMDGRASEFPSQASSPPASVDRPRLVVFREYFWDQADDAVRHAFRVTLDQLSNSGFELVAVKLPDSFADVHRMHRRLMAVGAADVHRNAFESHADRFGRHIGGLIAEGLGVSAVDYCEAVRHREQFRRDMARVLDGRIALMPSTPTPPPLADSTGDPKFNSPWSHAGVPSVTLPSGLSPDGLPCGLQIVGAPETDYDVLAAAEWFTTETQRHGDIH